MFNKTVVPLVIVFLLCAGLIFILREYLESRGFDWQVLSGGNLFIYIVTAISLHLLSKGLNAADTNAFLRNAYGGIMVKLFACAAAAFVYILFSGKNLNKPALFACMFLYLVYTFVEISIVLKRSNLNKNAKN